MNRGIVVNQTAKHLIVMTPDGVFDKIPREGRECRIGEEIFFTARRGRRHVRLFTVVSAMAAAAILSFVFVSWLSGVFPPGRVVAYVTVDINPSVEMGIDADQKVIVLRGLNPEGIQLVEQLEYKGKKIADVTGGLIKRAEEQGYLAGGPAEIVVTSTVVEPTAFVDENALIENLKKHIDNRIQENHSQQAREYRVTTISAPVELREQAQKNGISTGKYAIYLSAKHSGHSISIEQLKKEPISRLADKNIPLESILQQDHLLTKEEWKRLVQEERGSRSDQDGSGHRLAAQVVDHDENSVGDHENENKKSENNKKRNADQDDDGRKNNNKNNEKNDEEKRNRNNDNRDRDLNKNSGKDNKWIGNNDRIKDDGDRKRDHVRSRDNDGTIPNTRGDQREDKQGDKRGDEFSSSVDKGSGQGGRRETGGEQNQRYDSKNERNSKDENNTAREETDKREAESKNEEHTKKNRAQNVDRDGKNSIGAEQARSDSGKHRVQTDTRGAYRDGRGGEDTGPADKNDDKQNARGTDREGQGEGDANPADKNSDKKNVRGTDRDKRGEEDTNPADKNDDNKNARGTNRDGLGEGDANPADKNDDNKNARGTDRDERGEDAANPADKNSDKKNTGETDQSVQEKSASNEGRQGNSGGTDQNNGLKIPKINIPFINPFSLW